MKKVLSLNLMLAAAFALLATSAFAGPSRSFIQEMGMVQANKEVTIDLNETVYNGNLPAANGAAPTALGNSNLLNFQVNVGAFGGEVRIGQSLGAGYGNYIGYKAVVIPNLALYANVGYIHGDPSPSATGNTYTGETDLTIGGAYTFNLMPVILNLNPEYRSFNQSNSGTAGVYESSALNLNAAILFPLSADWIIGAEYLYSSLGWNNSSTGQITSENTIGLGIRWKANSNVTVDGVVYGNASASVDGGGTAPSYSAFGTPAILKVNVKL
ncbi:MAG TPA: hypothetical protein VN944_09635 [Nitrospiria bacterium]|nr:hypothetical protein [Nitrospiria bacterium]